MDTYLEIGRKRVFACAVDWPGWARSGKSEDAALETVVAYAPRFAPIAARAGDELPDVGGNSLRVVERVEGDATTDFGAPGRITELDRAATLDPADRERLAAYYEAAWATLDEVAATAPAELRKGPRGGGRDRDAVVQHVLAAERSYATKLGVRLKEPAFDDPEAMHAFRAQLADAIRAGAPDVDSAKAWPLPYGVRRIVWHIVDHVWEIEDRS
jgi:hypothetical protein